MGSLNIQTMRIEYPGRSDAEAAKAFAQKHGYIAIVRYKNSSSASDFTDIGVCQMEDQIRGYLNSPYCHNAEVIYDGRAAIGDFFQGVPLRKPSIFKKEAADSQKRVSSILPGGVVNSTTVVFSVYPKTQPNAPNYSSIGEAFCLIRFDFPDVGYRNFSSDLRNGKVQLTLKTYRYPSYPIIQFVIRINPLGQSGPSLLQETLGDITDGDIRDFITDACRMRKWKLVVARYNPPQEKARGSMIDPHEKVVSLSDEEVRRFIDEAQTATQHFLSIPAAQLDFARAANQLLRDNPPIE